MDFFAPFENTGPLWRVMLVEFFSVKENVSNYIHVLGSRKDNTILNTLISFQTQHYKLIVLNSTLCVTVNE